MLFEMLTSELAFRGDEPAKTMGKIVHEGVPYGRLDGTKAPRALKKIIRRATDRDPKRRYDAATELADDLERVLTKDRAYVSASSLAAYLRDKEMPRV
jgi:serine/threonine-protein kinase